MILCNLRDGKLDINSDWNKFLTAYTWFSIVLSYSDVQQIENGVDHYQGRQYFGQGTFAQEWRNPLRLWHCFNYDFTLFPRKVCKSRKEKMFWPSRTKKKLNGLVVEGCLDKRQ